MLAVLELSLSRCVRLDEMPRLRRCAVVLSGGALHANNWGREIDEEHDGIWRINARLLSAAYTVHTGALTTLQILSLASMLKRPPWRQWLANSRLPPNSSSNPWSGKGGESSAALSIQSESGRS